jgi:rhodanese-related sulfurtransferase
MNLQLLEHDWLTGLALLVMIVSGALWIWLTVRLRWSPIREIGALEATQLINRRDALMLDLREPKDFEGGRVPNAVHLPQSQLASRGHELGKLTGRPVIAYCERGQRSRAAGAALIKLGFAEVYTLRGGLRAWSDAGLPVEKGA